MDTIEHLRELFAFNDWANRKLVVTLKENESPSSLRYLAHSLTTEQEYFERLYGKDSTGFDFWPDLNIENCGALARENAERFEKLLAKFDDEGLGLTASYKTSEGIAYTNSFREILTHVLFHSMTHRGQALSALRRDGIEPPSIDYIIYLREKK